MVRKHWPWLAAALVLGACRDDTTSGPAAGLAPSFHRAGGERDALQFSDWSAPVRLDAPVNSSCQDQTPTLSRNELALYFMSNRRGGLGQDTPDGCQDTNDLWVAQRASRDSPWETPVNLGAPVNTSASEAGPALSPNGRLLFFYRFEGAGQRDIYVARRSHRNGDLGWEAPVKLGPDVNTDDSHEEGPSYTAHGEDGGPTLYFDRGLPPPATDLYAVPVTANGQPRGPAVVLTALNSSVEDNHSSVSANGRAIFFNSRRLGSTLNPSGQPSFDIWVATRASVHDAWSTPVNLGAPVNSQFAEFHPNLSFDGRTLLFISPAARGGLGFFDIWMTTRTELQRTVLVDPSGTGGRTAKTIQEGIAMVAPGGRVRVAPGTYHEQVTVSKNDIVIVAGDEDDEGDERGGVVVNAHGHDFGFLVRNAVGVRIEGFRVEQAHEADIALDGATFTTIRKNVTSAAGHDGIQLFASNDNVIEHNVAADNLAPNACGVNVFGGSKRNVVRKNRLVNNEYGIQIVGATTLDNVISENRVLRNRGNGIRNLGALGTIIEENRVSGNGFAPSALTGTTAAGIRIGSGVGIVVRENRASGNLLVDLLLEAAATAAVERNECGTSSPPGLCERGEDDDDDDNDRRR